MSSRDRLIVCILLLNCALIFTSAAHSAQDENTRNSCVHCHFQLADNTFLSVKSHSWKGSIHQQHGVTCDQCHGGNPSVADKGEAHVGVLSSSNPQSRVYFKNIPTTCGHCHGAELYKFKQSRHYRMLESTGQGPDCVTCHGSMTTTILTPETVASVCARCHNERMNIFPYIPEKAKAVLLLLRESQALLAAKEKSSPPAEGTPPVRQLREARAALHSAKLDWHRFDLDTITSHLEKLYNSLEATSKP